MWGNKDFKDLKGDMDEQLIITNAYFSAWMPLIWLHRQAIINLRPRAKTLAPSP